MWTRVFSPFHSLSFSQSRPIVKVVTELGAVVTGSYIQFALEIEIRNSGRVLHPVATAPGSVTSFAPAPMLRDTIEAPAVGQFVSAHWAVIFAFTKFQSGIAYEEICSKNPRRPVSPVTSAGVAAGERAPGPGTTTCSQ